MDRRAVSTLARFVLRNSVLAVLTTSLFAMIPIDILSYFATREYAFEGQATWLPVEWLCGVGLTVGIVYSLPILVGNLALTAAILTARARLWWRLSGGILGAAFGLLAFAAGTAWFLKLTQDLELMNWAFWASMLLWGVAMFSLVGHRAEEWIRARIP